MPILKTKILTIDRFSITFSGKMERKQEVSKSKSSNDYKDSTKEYPNGHKNSDKAFLVDPDANHLLSGTS